MAHRPYQSRHCSPGGNQETGTLIFTLKITPQNQSLPSYTVTPALVNVHGDGFYSASYTVPAGLAGTYTWTATYSGDTSNNPAGPTNLGTVTVQTPSVYAIFNGSPITQYWYYPTAAINTAALLYHVDLDQPIGYFGTNPNVPPAALVTGNSQLLPIWVGITYSPMTPTVGVSPAPGTGVTMQISIPKRETVITKAVAVTVPGDTERLR